MPSKKGIAKAVLVGFMVRNENRNMPDAGMPGWRCGRDRVAAQRFLCIVVLSFEGLDFGIDFVSAQFSILLSLLSKYPC